MSKRDEIRPFFDRLIMVTSISQILFYANFVPSIAMLFAPSSWHNLVFIFALIFSIGYVTTCTFAEIWLFYDAELERRKDFLCNSLGVNITELQTEGYYNNESHMPSIIKMGVNCFENIFFSVNNLKITAWRERVKAFIWLLIFVFSCLMFHDKKIVLILAQFTFSGVILIKSTRQIVYKNRVQKLYEQFHAIFIETGITHPNQLIQIIQYVMDYECLKSSSKTLLSTKIFNEHNKEWSNKWDNIKKKIAISKDVESIAMVNHDNRQSIEQT